MFRPKLLCLASLLAASICVHGMGAEIFDDFEAYAAGGGVSGQGIWTTWDGAPVDGVVSTEQAASGAQSLKVVGDNDVVGIFNKMKGVWEFSVKVFVPSNHVGTSYVILMAKYGGPGGSGPDYVWAPQIELVDTSRISDGAASLPLVTDAWAEIKVVANLVANTKSIFYNGELLNQGIWSSAVGLSAVDLYGGSGSSAVYFDDVTLSDVTPEATETWTAAQVGVAGRFDHYNPSVRAASAALDGFEPGYVVRGSGGDIWGDWDSFTFAYDEGVRVVGDFDATIQIVSFTKADGTSEPCEWGRAGLMLRDNLGNGSPYAFVGVNGLRRVLSYSRQNNGTNFWGDTGDAAGGNTDQKTLPIWMRLTRTGNTYRFYWKQNEGDAWIQLREHPRDWTPPELMLGFGVQNHNNCVSEPAAIAKFANLSVTDSTGPVALTPLAPVGAFGLTAAAHPAGVAAKWEAVGTPESFLAERTSVATIESLTLPGALREAVDDTAPPSFLTYKLTPYGAGGVPGGSRRVSLWATGLTAAGHVTAWVTTPLLNQPYGADPGPANMLKDFLAEGANGPANETNILPVPGTQIRPEYNGAAASTGANCDSKAGCVSSPLTFLLAQNEENGTLDCCDYFNCADNVMNYMIAYVTNHTDADLPIRFNYQTDDAVSILIDNTVWHMDRVCCYSATGYGFLPPGEHRLMLKIWEGGGGHNGWIRLLQKDGSVYPTGTITASPYPTMTSVPPALSPPPGMTMSGTITDWLIIGQYKQSGGCGPTPAFMAQDFLTEGEGFVTEENIVPTEGMYVFTDYDVAASDGCEKGTAPGAECDPVKVLATQAADGRVNFSTIFGDQDNIMAYLVCYLTNRTDDFVYCDLRTGSDDSILVKLDNIVVRAVQSCRGYTANQDSGLLVVPPGTHRLMAKVFEGGGGFDGGVSLLDWAGGIFPPTVFSVSLTPPEGFTVPPAPQCIGDLAARRGADRVTLSWTNGDAYDRFVVERKAVLTNTWTVLADDIAGNATTFVDTAPDTTSAAVYYRVTPYVIDGNIAVCSLVVGIANPGYLVYQEGLLPTPAYDGTADSQIITYLKDANMGGHDHFEEGDWNGGNGDHKEGLIKFELGEIPGDKPVTSATLGLYFDFSRDGAYNDHVGYVRQVLKEWNQGTGYGPDGPAALPGEVTWNSARHNEELWQVGGAYGTDDILAPSSEVQATYGANAATWVTWGGDGLTAMVQDWLDAVWPNYGMKITQCPNNDPLYNYVDGAYNFCSSEYGDPTLRPVLILAVENSAPTVAVAPAGPVSIELCGASADLALTATVNDPDGDPVTVEWTSTGGTVATAGDPPTTATVTFTALGDYVVTCTVRDGLSSLSQDVAVSVVECAGGRQRPGDINQDANLDLSDAVALLNHLFLGTLPALPCGDGTVEDAANIALADGNGDGKIDLSDAIYVLSFLFLGGPRPAGCIDDLCPCIPIAGCPDVCP